MLKLYNTLSRKKEEFVPIEAGKVGLYTCGPTVYWFAHVGNFRAYIFADILRRVLSFDGFDVKHIINVTDVGHLTSDADEGEDKMESAAAKEGKSASEVSRFYFDAFKKDFLKLNLIEPFKWTWATEHIGEQIDMIKTLEGKGFVYITSDGVYFDSSKFGAYGKLSRKVVAGLEGGKRIDLGEKKNVTDFALWKFSKPEDCRQQEWDSPWGRGFPGWHIECSAMAAKYLGKTFDIHTGGEDHIPVHHENEIAQSTCAFGVKPVNYWMHGAFLNIKGGKMSKSLGNIETVSQLEERGIDALAYRYFCLTASYRKPLTWSEDALSGAVNSYKTLRNVCLSLEDDGKLNEAAVLRFKERVDDDLDMPGALAELWKMIRNLKVGGIYRAVEKMDEVFGLRLFEREGGIIKIAKISAKNIDVITDLLSGDKAASYAIVQRVEAREAKNWTKSDKLRDEIAEMGWNVKDGKDGIELERA